MVTRRAQPKGLLVLASAVLAVLAGCGTGSSGGSIAVTAGEKTTAAGRLAVSVDSRTFDTANPSHTEATSTGHGLVDLTRSASDVTQTSTSASASSIAGAGDQQTEQITIGPDTWIKGFVSGNGLALSPSGGLVTENSKPWVHLPRRTGNAHSPFGSLDPSTMLASLKSKGAKLRLVGHDTIRGAGTDHYAVTTPAPVTTTSSPFFLNKGDLDVWIDSNDLVRRFRLAVFIRAQSDNTPPTPAEAIEQTIEFFNFGVSANIQPPPPGQVMEFPTTPSCATSGGATTTTTASGIAFCTGSQGETPTTAPSLPKPTVAGRSALQLRPVRSFQKGSCSAPTANPPADQPVTLPGPNGTCYTLAPSALTISHAAVSAEADVSNQLAIRLTMDPGDAAAFDRLASSNYQHQVAIVMFGRVLSAPTINATQFNGTAVITPIDPQTAANVIAALAG